MNVGKHATGQKPGPAVAIPDDHELDVLRRDEYSTTSTQELKLRAGRIVTVSRMIVGTNLKIFSPILPTNYIVIAFEVGCLSRFGLLASFSVSSLAAAVQLPFPTV